MATSIGLHFCKLLRSSLNICLEFAPPQTNQEFYMKALFLLSKIPPSFIYLKGFNGESWNS